MGVKVYKAFFFNRPPFKKTHKKCKNKFGGYDCYCREGFRLFEDGRTCIDLNECTENGNRCEHLCENLYGSYKERS